MSQRNPNNDRYKEGGKKGVTRKMSGSAKPKSTAGSSVYVADKKSKSAREKKSKGKDKGLSEQEKKVVEAGNEAKKDYRYFRNVWLAMIVIAVVGVALSFIAPRVMVEGGALSAFAQYQLPVQTAGLVAGYAALIAAFIVDWRKLRPIRKAEGVIRRKESKKERAHREAAEAEKASKKSFFSRKKD